VDEGELERVVEKHSWENIPEEEKGEGKFYRKATPGGWREDLSPEQAEAIERITAPLMKELYPNELQSEKPPEKSSLS
jgi:Sulfotransferase domain